MWSPLCVRSTTTVSTIAIFRRQLPLSNMSYHSYVLFAHNMILLGCRPEQLIIVAQAYFQFYHKMLQNYFWRNSVAVFQSHVFAGAPPPIRTLRLSLQVCVSLTEAQKQTQNLFYIGCWAPQCKLYIANEIALFRAGCHWNRAFLLLLLLANVGFVSRDS